MCRTDYPTSATYKAPIRDVGLVVIVRGCSGYVFDSGGFRIGKSCSLEVLKMRDYDKLDDCATICFHEFLLSVQVVMVVMGCCSESGKWFNCFQTPHFVSQYV